MVDALELKIEFLTECPFESDQGHHPTRPRKRIYSVTACLGPDNLLLMDARAKKQVEPDDDLADEALTLAEAITAKRDRLLASLTLIAGISFIVGLPFALRAGAEFFMPVTAALVVAIALVPLLEWFERRGIAVQGSPPACAWSSSWRLAVFAIGSIVVPATDWVAQVPSKIPKVRAALEPVIRALQASRPLDRQARRLADCHRPGAADAHGQRRTAAFDARPAHQLGSASADPAVLRAAGDLLLPRRLDRDAEENDRQPRQLRRGADHCARHPAGGRCDLDLSWHDHAHQHRAGRADRAAPCGCLACPRR